MADVMAQQRTGLSALGSRQDVVSALLSAYGSSFSHGDASPLAYAPVPAEKELPPPPPRSDSLHNKPVSSVQRAEERMSTKFQLRAHEEVPVSPNGTQRGRRKILYRSLSREAKPASLNLTVSNGSTAIVPPTPAFPVQLQKSPGPSDFEKSLPSPPPPPPIKSDRRPGAQQTMPATQQPKAQSELARNDSLLSQGETKPVRPETPPMTDMPSVVKRKALPLPAVRKFRSLAELGTGPRGGKGGPLPPTSTPKTDVVTERVPKTSQNETTQSQQEEPSRQPQEQVPEVPAMDHLPPTPEDEKSTALPIPAPPRKAFVGMGLPSHPRAKDGPISPKHARGKSSTGFDVLKAQRPAPPIPTKQEAITPEMTPSPELKPNDEAKMDIISPVSPLPPPSDQQRPFSFEAAKPPGPMPEHVPALESTRTPITAIRTPDSATATREEPMPQRPTSMDLEESSPLPFLSAAPAPESSTPPDPTTAKAPTPVTTVPIPNLPPSPISENSPTPPPFAPLTEQSIPIAATLIPLIAPSQLRCYTKHATSIWSNNIFQPMGCMICYSNDKDRKWTCTWCRLRICRDCSEQLSMVPGRSLGKLLEARNETGRGEQKKTDVENPGIVVSGVDDLEA